MPVSLVTGASSGIGAAIARELARRGHDLVLVARDPGQLAHVADATGARCELLPADLTDPAGCAAVEARLGAAPGIDVCVNNAGVGSYGPFHTQPVDDEDRQVRLNVLAVVRLSHAAARAMAARGGGAILNVSSLASFQPIPDNATYAATKAFVTSFGQALHEELRPLGVRVTTLCPGYTRTDFHRRARVELDSVPAFLWQDADAVARAGIDALERGRALCVPGAANKALAALASAAPGVVTRKAARVLNGRHG